MRLVCLLVTSLIVSSQASAQTPPASGQPTEKHNQVGNVERPVDKGPYTPAANGAYQGGGVVLQGGPGAPAPQPKATPPGQSPAGAVPQ